MAELSAGDIPGPSVIINGVLCKVITSGYNEKCDQSGPSATRGYLCDWDKRFTVANALLGIVAYTGTGPSGTVGLPERGKLDDIPSLVTMGVRIEPKGQPYYNNVGLGYPYAIIWVDYGITPYSSGGGEAQIDPNTSFVYATQELDSSNQYVEIPGQVLTYADDGSKSTVNRSIIVTVVEMRITFNRMPYIPMPALAYADQINDALFLGIARGKVKFDGLKVSRDYSDPTGAPAQKASYQFSYRPIADWNAVPSPSAPGTWTALKYRGTSIYPYPYVDMRAIWPGTYVNSL